MPALGECATRSLASAMRGSSVARYIPAPIQRTIVWLITHGPTGNAFLLRVYDAILWRIDGPVQCRTYFGATMVCDPRDLIQGLIFHFGVWEPNISAVFETLLQEGDVAVDVGANVGYDTLLAARLVGPTGKVVSIEASPSIFAKLTGNLMLNPGLSVECVNVAVSDRNETLSIFQGPPGNSGKTSTQTSRGFNFECTVQAKPLTEIIDPELLARVRLIKIDIEGGEVPVLRHLLENLPLFPESMALIVEISPSKEWDELFARLLDAGFAAYSISNSYDRSYYIAHRNDLVAPEKIVDAPLEQTDVLFTRIPFDRFRWPPNSQWGRLRRLS